MPIQFLGSHRQLGEHFRALATHERYVAQMTTDKEARFHEGKARAFEQMATTIEAFVLRDGLPELNLSLDELPHETLGQRLLVLKRYGASQDMIKLQDALDVVGNPGDILP